MLWEPLKRKMQSYQIEGANLQESLHQASHEVVREQLKRVALSKRFSLILHEIWTLQSRLEKRGNGKRPLQTLHHPRFRAAYDFLALRAKADPDLRELAEWWDRLYHAAPEEREALLSAPRQSGEKRRRRGKRKPKTTVPQAITDREAAGGEA
jgi:poly(A) polymerase